MILVEKVIPMPDTKYARYPFPVMEIGDSFAVPIEKIRSVIHSAAQQKVRKGLVFRVRKVSETEARCWRVA